MKKLLSLIIIITFIFAAWGLSSRIDNIDSSSRVEVILDGEAYQQLRSLEPELELAELKDAGLSGVALYQKNIEDLSDEGSLKRLEGIDLAFAGSELKQQLAAQNLDTESLAQGALFAVLTEGLNEQVNRLAPVLKAEYDAEIIQAADINFLYFPNWNERLEKIDIGFNAELASQVGNGNLELVYRSGNDLNSLAVLRNSLNILDADMLIFDGEEVTGFPEKLNETAELLSQKGTLFGYIEAFIADQAGAKKLAELTDLNILRTHSMQQEEVETSSPEIIVERYLRAVRERSVRVIYFKPYLEGSNLLERNSSLLNMLKNNLNEEGYSVGAAEAEEYFSGSQISLLLILFGVTAAGIMLLNYFSDFKYAKLMNIFFLLSLGAAFLLMQSGRLVLLRQITALGAACIFPSLAVIAFLLERPLGGEDLRSDSAGTKSTAFQSDEGKTADQLLAKNYLLHIFMNFSGAVLTAFIGGIFVSSALNTSDFIFKLQQFRGVKVAFLMPLIIISLYYLLQLGSSNLKNEIPQFMEQSVKIKHVLLAGVLFFIAVVYIGRTGNFPLLPVPPWEMTVRSLLEKVLYVRPRFKEFLIGHPLFVLALWLSAEKRKELYFYPLLMLASVGVVTTVNTFSHLHTPVMVSVLRTFHSYWLGLLIGVVFIIGYELIKFLYNRYYLSE